MKKWLVCITALAALFALAACGDGESEEVLPYGDVTELRIALSLDETNPFAGIANEDFRKDMEDFLGIPVVAIEDMGYVVSIEALRAGHLDIMSGSSFNTLSAMQVVDLEPLASLPHGDSNTGGGGTVFITQADRNDINTLADLEGKTFAFVNPASTSGFFFPAYHLITNLQLDSDLLMQSGYFFSTTVFSGSHDASIMGVSFGDFDAACVANMLIDMLVDSGVVAREEFKIIDETPPAPGAVYSIRSDMPEELIEKVREFLLTYSNEEYFESIYESPDRRFGLPDLEGFAYVAQMAEVLGMDLG